MKPTLFSNFVQKHGTEETYSVGEVFHTHDFPNKLFLLTEGYVKRYQATIPDQKVIELLYGPSHIISLSQLYKILFGVNQNQNNYVYVYQAMTDVRMMTISTDLVLEELERSPEMHKDFFYESGIKLRSNIFRLANNAIKDDYKRVAHLLVSLAYEFAGLTDSDFDKTYQLPFPESPLDIAEQLSISEQVAGAVLGSLTNNKLIEIKDNMITIVNIDLLRDTYL